MITSIAATDFDDHQVDELQHVLTDLIFMNRGESVTCVEDLARYQADMNLSRLSGTKALKPM
jgi:hypothetical protein